MTASDNTTAIIVNASIQTLSGHNLRLVGTKGASAVVGQVMEIKNGSVCWKLHPDYGAWFWPLMLKLKELVLSVPEALLEPAEEGDCIAAPRAPDDAEKDKVLKMPELAKDDLRVYSLVIKGKYPSVHKAFPLRTANLGALRYYRKCVVDRARKSQRVGE
jgi:hypothetical protein